MNLQPGDTVTVKKGTPIYDVSTGSKKLGQTTLYAQRGVANEDATILFIGYSRGNGTRGKMALLRLPDMSILAVDAIDLVEVKAQPTSRSEIDIA